jgi:hypothetical protein
MSETIDADYINAVFENVRKDSSLLATLNMEELMKSVEKNSYLENKTLDDLLEEKLAALNTLPLPRSHKKEICDKLTDYRYVQNIYELHKGKHIRWIKKEGDYKLTNGCLVSDIIFTDNGTNIQCLGYFKNVFQIKWDKCLVFQKLSVNEQLILMVYDHMIKENSKTHAV